MYDSKYTGAQVDAKLDQVKGMGASGTNHSAGLVPDTPSTAGTTKFLREDGTWQVPNYTSYSNATQSAAGLMSAADKKKVDNVLNLVSDSNSTSITLSSMTPNTFYSYGTLTSLTISALGSPAAGITNEYAFEFDSGSTATTVSLPSGIVWQDDLTSVDAKTHYEVSIKYDASNQTYYGLWAAWS